MNAMESAMVGVCDVLRRQNFADHLLEDLIAETSILQLNTMSAEIISSNKTWCLDTVFTASADIHLRIAAAAVTLNLISSDNVLADTTHQRVMSSIDREFMSSNGNRKVLEVITCGYLIAQADASHIHAIMEHLFNCIVPMVSTSVVAASDCGEHIDLGAVALALTAIVSRIFRSSGSSSVLQEYVRTHGLQWLLKYCDLLLLCPKDALIQGRDIVCKAVISQLVGCLVEGISITGDALSLIAIVSFTCDRLLGANVSDLATVSMLQSITMKAILELEVRVSGGVPKTQVKGNAKGKAKSKGKGKGKGKQEPEAVVAAQGAAATTVQVDVSALYTEIVTKAGFFDSLCDMLLCDIVIVRKRAIYLLEHSVAFVMSAGSTDREARDGYLGKRHWVLDFIDIYHQVDGCSSGHLIDQVWEYVRHLFRYVYQTDARTAGCGVPGGWPHPVLPPVAFKWVKVIINAVLASKSMTVRKTMVYRLLACRDSADTLLLFPTEEVVHWFCFDMLKRLDQAAVFFGGIGHRSSQICLSPTGENTEASEGEVQVVLTDSDYRLHPGLLLPNFVREFNLQILSHPAVQVRTKLSKMLHISLIQMICLTDDTVLRSGIASGSRPAVGLGSLLAIKWLMRAFPLAAQPAPVATNDPISTSYDILHSRSSSGLYCCCCEASECSCYYFGLDELTLVKNQMLGAKLLAGNLVVGTQILNGLLPWVFSRISIDDTNAIAVHAGGNRQRYACLVLKQVLSILNTTSFSIKSTNVGHQCPLSRMLAVNTRQVQDTIARIMSVITDESELEACFSLDSGGYAQRDLQLLGIAHVLNTGDSPFLCAKFEAALQPFAESACHEKIVSDHGRIWVLEGVCSAVQSVQSTAPVSTSAYNRAVGIRSSLISAQSSCLLTLTSHIVAMISETLSRFGAYKDETELVMSTIQSLELLDAYCSLLAHCVVLVAGDGGQIPHSCGVVVLLQKCAQWVKCRTESGSVAVLKFLSATVANQLVKGILAAQTEVVTLLHPLTELTEAMVTAPEISMSEYKAARETLTVAAACVLDSTTPSLEADMLLLVDRFSRCANHFMICRWSCVQACIQIVGSANLVLVHLPKESDPVETLVDLLTAHMETSIPQVTTLLIRSARSLCSSVFGSSPRDAIGRSAGKLEIFLAACWHSCANDGAQENIGAIGAFIEFLLDPAVFAAVEFMEMEVYIDRLIELGANARPYVMQCLVFHLVALWKTDPSHSIKFFPRYMQVFALYKEPVLDDHSLTDSLTVSTADEAMCRCMILKFIEDMKSGFVSGRFTPDVVVQLQQCMDGFVADLLMMNIDPRCGLITPAMVGSESFGTKLRSWQTLCILATHVTPTLLNHTMTVTIGKESLECSVKQLYFMLLLQNVPHNIRVHIEIFGAALLLSFPDEMLPPFYAALDECNTAQQVLASYFIILGHLLADVDVQTGASHLPLEHYEPMASRLMPWLSCAGGLPRCIAQLVMFELVPKILDVTKPTVSESMHFSYLRGIYNFLASNKDSVKMVNRQRRFFSDAPIRSRLTLEGLMKHVAADHTGERVPEHLISVVVATLKSLEYSFSNESKSILLQTEAPDAGAISTGSDADDNTPCFQTKRTPFEELQVQMAEASTARHRNASGRRRQDVIVCASLIDKAVNVAGIARTCEIFAVELLTISSMDITHTDEFQGVAVSCTEWLPMEEVSEANLLPFIHRCRQKGYTIVGLEQTETSIDLSDPIQTAQLPRKCVLILGKEKEGVPVQILNQLDVCIEIPQFGIIRSLNVHVSAAMALWEITKNNMPELRSTMG